MLRTITSQFETARSGYAVRTGILALVLGVVGAILFLFGPATIAVAGDTTIQRFVLLTAYLSMIVSLSGYRLLTDEQDKISRIEKLAERTAGRDWIGRFTVSAAVAWILATACQAIFLLLIDKVFTGVEVSRFVIMAMFAFYSAILGFGVAFFVVGVDDLEVNWLLIVLGVGGILFSITIVANANWWQRSVSALGIDGGSGTFFNITIIILGLIALTLGRDLIADIKLLVGAGLFAPRGFSIIRVGLTGIGLGIVGVGLFPTEGLSFSHDLHLVAAHVMAIFCIAGMLFLNLIAPRVYSRRFIYFSGLLGVVCIATIIANFAGRLEFVAMELTLFGLFGLWVFFFRVETILYVRRQVIAEIRRELTEVHRLGQAAILNQWFLKYPRLVAAAMGTPAFLSSPQHLPAGQTSPES